MHEVSDFTIKNIRGKYKYIFVDEYQDTNLIQESLINAVSTGDNVFMVGDVKQSIYAFRNAEPKIFTDKFHDYKKANCKVKQFLYEIKNFEKEVKEGSILILSDLFQEGEFIDVVGLSKGKGFQGVVKRHGFSGVGGQTHGQHNRMRHPGSVGASSFPSRVFKGERMAGRMGGDRVTVKNLKVLKILQDKNIIVVNGCIPGCNNSFVVLQK